MAAMFESGKRSKSIILTAIIISCCVSLLLLNNIWHFSDLRVRILSTEPTPTTIPKKLWYKLGPKGLSDDTREWTDTCIKNNTGYDVEFMTDSSADVYVQNTFSTSHPELVELYLGLTVPIWKADILRYLLLFTEGGIYFDLDVSCEMPISQWIPEQFEHDASVIVGWEFDVGWGDNIVREFATWAIMAKARSPHIWMVIEDIIHSFQDKVKKNNVPIEGLTMEMVGDVVDATGPRRFTRGILRSIDESFNATLKDVEKLLEPKLVGDVLVLPGYAFAASSNTYDESMEVPPPLLEHHYAGSWKNEKGGEMA